MNILLRIYPGDAWVLLIAKVLVQVTAVIVTAQLLARLGSRWNAAWRHSIYLVAIVCVLASPLLSGVMQTTGITLVMLRPPVPTASPVEPAPAARVDIPESSRIDTPAAAEFPASRQRLERESPGSVELLRPASPPGPALADILRAVAAAAMLIWLLGLALLSARWCYGLHLMAALRRASRPLDGAALADLLRPVRQALGTERLPPLATSAGLDRPVMVGLFRPLVILPENVLQTLPPAELADVLVHECAHAICRHQVVGLLQRAAAALFWPHPLVHLLNRELARAREEVCDNYVLRHSAAPRYARTLLELSQLLVGVSPKPVALGLFHCPWRLENRIADLLDQRRKVMVRVSRGTAAALTAALLLLAVLIAGTRILQAAPLEHRAVHKRAKDFPEKTDFSTPESALAAALRNMSRNDYRAALDLSWIKIDAETVEEVEDALKHDPNAPKNLAPLYLDVEIIEVLTYHDDFAAVICKGSVALTRGPNADGSLPAEQDYDHVWFGRINGIWKALEGFEWEHAKDHGHTYPSAQAAAENFEKQKDDLWRRFVELRNALRNGRTPVLTLSETKEGGWTVTMSMKPGEPSAPTVATPAVKNQATANAKGAKTAMKTPTEIVRGERPHGNCSISGKLVSAATGKPLDHGSMYLFYLPTYCAIFVNVAADGTFVFKDIPKGPYTLRSTHVAGYQGAVYDPEGKSGQLPQFSLNEGQQRAGIVLAAQPACRISGKIRDEKGEIPEAIDHLTVLAWFETHHRNEKVYESQQATVDRADGSFVIDGLGAKPVYVMAIDWHAARRGNAYPPVYYPGTFFRSDAKRITFDKQQRVDNINITLQKAGGLLLEGTVLDAAGKPVPEAFVVAHRRDMLFDFATAYSDQQGHYAIGGLGDGQFLVPVDAVHRGWVRTRTPIDLDRAHKSTRLDFTLTRGVTISGKFVDEKGHDWQIAESHGYAANIDKGRHPSSTFSLTNFRNKYRPKDVQESSGGTFCPGEGPYDNNEMIFPTSSTFIIQGMMPGKTTLGFFPQKEGQKLLKILHDGREIKRSGPLTTTPGQTIDDITIVIAKQ